jgi:predicted nucleic acid-binding protein
LAVVLDTSAVIGWLERRNQRVADAIGDLGEVPLIHVVTLGELHEGVARARDLPEDDQRSRAATLRFTLDELDLASPPDAREAEVFGVVSAATSRRLSHNDKWIASRAILGGHSLITEDDNLADAIETDAVSDAIQALGLPCPAIIRCTPRASPAEDETSD